MNAHQFSKRLQKLNEKYFGLCSYCRNPHIESCHTFSGLDYDNKVQDVGYCCKGRLAIVYVAGIYMAIDMNTPEGIATQRYLESTHPFARHYRRSTRADVKH
ncbi:hypothetical protein BCT54_19565 [Vibrio splendidus]|uniref:Uncharacterized protein n=1 Tax=Vibrio splendidus TaxID=29497 RepID=A0A2N7JTW0_VIBSP|nr:hypothetical protein BCT54_19565 [Vibrio splendidus]